MDERSRSNKLRYVYFFIYFGDDIILKVCGKFSVIYLDVNIVHKVMILIMKPFSGYILSYIYK